MTSNGSTSLSQLPNPNQNSGLNNISLNTQEISTNNIQQVQQNMQLNNIENTSQNQIINDQNNYNELIGQLQTASSKGSTQLPSKHIQSGNTNIDENINNNYIPKAIEQEDYIQNQNTKNDLIDKNTNKNLDIFKIENLYNEIQIPIIIAILYCIFQLPYFKKSLFKILPILFDKDSNLNLNGIIFNSIVFALTCYILNKSISILSN
jgi:hypothetical protein